MMSKRQKTLRIGILGIVVAMAGGLSSQGARAAELRIAGGPAAVNNILKKVQTPFEKATGNKLIISEENPDVSLADLNEGKLDCAMAGMKFDEWVKLPEKIHRKPAKPEDFTFRVVGGDRVAVLASQGVGVNSLTQDQLASIFSGAATNWKEVGGKDVPILVVIASRTPGVNKVFRKRILDGKKFSPSAKTVGISQDLADVLSKNPGGVGLTPSGFDISHQSQVKSLEIPVIGRPMFAVTKGKPSPEMHRFFRFLVGEGKKYLGH
jgi:phosphate transport system substrate-binding protein